ncbi:AMP-binding protein [Candidatus Poribacteria bacterium]
MKNSYCKYLTNKARRVRPTNSFIEFKTEEVEQSVPDRFEEQVRKYPKKLAVKSGSYSLTYDELNRAVNCVAHSILARRRGKEEPVALLFEHGISLIIAIFGISKAGKIYVPLDPLYPPARLAHILEHSQTSLIVTNNKNLSFAQELAQSGPEIINIDELDSSIPDENPGLSISPDAYVSLYYTSGSTGDPKGVIENHRNRLYGVMEQTNGMGICADDRLTFLASAGFSASIGDIFPALLNGAALFPFDLRSEGLGSLAEWMIREGITFYNSSPTVFRQFVDTLAGDEKFPRLRLIRMNSEPVYRWDVELYKKHFSRECLLANGWGATELPYFRLYLMSKDTQITDSNVPIGYADEIEGLMLLDDDDQPVGLDQPGEIVVKSRYLAPGYWRRPDLTQSRFLPDPDGGDERICRTGDMGLVRSDGSIIHLGRRDFQIKIRGSRVEVAEIEKALLDLDSIQEAAVVAREYKAGGQRLVVYIVPQRQHAPTVTALRRELAEQFPDYMIPSVFVTLDALPLTATGKIDRLALPDPGAERPELDTPFVAPRSPVEETLAEIWSQVLDLDEVGVHDSFFELGGHSLLVTQIVSRVASTFRVKVPLRSLFQSPTVADIAVVISQNQLAEMEHKDIDRMLTELEMLSDEELEQLLANEEVGDGNTDKRS